MYIFVYLCTNFFLNRQSRMIGLKGIHPNQFLPIFLSNYCNILYSHIGFPGGSEVRNPPAMQEMQIRSLGQEDLLEEHMANHCSSLARKIPWTEKSGRLQSMRSQRVVHRLRHLSIHRHMPLGTYDSFPKTLFNI